MKMIIHGMKIYCILVKRHYCGQSKKEDVNHTSIVEFTQLVTNTTEALALNYETQIIQKMENFTMKPTCGIGGCDLGHTDLTENTFETTQFLDRNIFKAMTLE